MVFYYQLRCNLGEVSAVVSFEKLFSIPIYLAWRNSLRLFGSITERWPFASLNFDLIHL